MSSTVWCWSTSRSPSARSAEIEAAVAGEELEHVVEEPDAGPDVVSALAVERQLDGDRRLRRLPFNHAAPHRTSSSAWMHAWVCSTTPVVIRTQPGHAGSRDLSRTCTPRAARPVDDCRRAVAEMRQDEVSVAWPEANPGLLERVIEQRLRRSHLGQIPVVVVLVGEASRERRRGADVEAERRHDAPERFERRRIADERARAHAGEPVGFGERSADEDVRQRGDVRVADQRRPARSRRRPRRRARSHVAPAARCERCRPRGISRPVGLFGLVRNSRRVCGPMASRIRSAGNAKSVPAALRRRGRRRRRPWTHTCRTPAPRRPLRERPRRARAAPRR